MRAWSDRTILRGVRDVASGEVLSFHILVTPTDDSLMVTQRSGRNGMMETLERGQKEDGSQQVIQLEFTAKPISLP